MSKINLNSVLRAYGDFAERSVEKAPDAKIVSRIGISGKDGAPRVVASTTDSCGVWNRDNREQVKNNKSRFFFFKAVAAQFGGVDKIPQKVRDALYVKDFGDVKFEEGEELTQAKFMTGKPLQAYRIQKVIKAIESVTVADVKLLAENRVQGVLGILKSGRIDREKLKDALTKLIDDALPPKWWTSKNFDRDSLRRVFNAGNIRELRDRIMGVPVKEIISTATGEAGSAAAHGDAAGAAAKKIGELLANMRSLFNGSHVGKGSHVAAFYGKFEELNGNWEGRSVRYDSQVRAQSLTERIGSTSEHRFDPNRRYAVGSVAANEFAGDLLHAMAIAQEGNFQCKGDGRASELNLLTWVKDRLCEAYLSSLPDGEYRGKLRSLVRGEMNYRHDATKGVQFQIKQLVDYLAAMAGAKETQMDEKDRTARLAWFEDVRKNLESFGKGGFSIGKELLRCGLIRPFSNADRHLIRQIATNARAGHRIWNEPQEAPSPANPTGREGGAGYMGLLGGEPFKFLTKFFERAQIADALTLKELAQANAATKGLRCELNRLAEQTGDETVIGAVKKLLEPKVSGKNALDLIARADVAMALAYIEPYVIDENGNMGVFGGSRWIEDDTSLKSMLQVNDADAKTGIRSDADAIRYLNGEPLASEKPVAKPEEKIENGPGKRPAANQGANRETEIDTHGKNERSSGTVDKVVEKRKHAPRPDAVNDRIRQDPRLHGVFEDAGFGADVKFRHVRSSGEGFNCLFHSIKNALGAAGLTIPDVGRFRNDVEEQARQRLLAFCGESGIWTYDTCLANPKGLPSPELVAYAEYLSDLRRNGQVPMFADAALLNVVIGLIRRPAILVSEDLNTGGLYAQRFDNGLGEAAKGASPIVIYYNGIDHFDAVLPEASGNGGGAAPGGAPKSDAEVAKRRREADYHPIPKDNEPGAENDSPSPGDLPGKAESMENGIGDDPFETEINVPKGDDGSESGDEEEEILKVKNPTQPPVAPEIQVPKQGAGFPESPDAGVAFNDFLTIARNCGGERIILSEDPASGSARLSVRQSSQETDYNVNRRTMDSFGRAMEKQYGAFGKLAFEMVLADRYMAKQGLRGEDVLNVIDKVATAFKVAIDNEMHRQLMTDPSYMYLGKTPHENLAREVDALLARYDTLNAIESLHVASGEIGAFTRILIRTAVQNCKINIDFAPGFVDDRSKAGWTASETMLKEDEAAGFALLFEGEKMVDKPISYDRDQTSVERRVKTGNLASGMSVNDGADNPVVLVGLKDKGVEPGFKFRNDWRREDTIALMHKAQGDEVSLAAFAEFLLKTYGTDPGTKIGTAVFAALGVKVLSQEDLEARLADATELAKLKRRAFVELRDEIVSPSPATKALPEFNGKFRDVGTRFRTENILKLDYSEGDENVFGMLTLSQRVMKRSDRKHAFNGIRPNIKHFESMFRWKSRDGVNADAISEALANDLMRLSGIPTQEMSLTVGQYSDGKPKLMLQAKFEPNYRDLDSANKGKSVLADGGYLAEGIEIGRFAEQKVFMMLLGDRDAIGSKGQNKGVRIGPDGKMTFFAIDPGHSLEGKRLKVADDFSFSGKSASDFKNYTVFDDFLRSEKFKGVLRLKELKGKYQDLFNGYRTNVEALRDNEDVALEKDMAAKILARIGRMEAELMGQYDHILEVFKDQIELHKNVSDRFGGQVADKAIDAIELFEKITSPTSEHSSADTRSRIRLRHLRIEKGRRQPWKAKMSEDGGLEFQSVGRLPDDAVRNLMGILPDAFGRESYSVVKKTDGGVVVRIESQNVQAFLMAGSEDAVKAKKRELNI